MRKNKATIAAEQAAEQAQRSRIHAALHWTDDTDIGPDVPPPARGPDLTTGYVFNAYSRRVEVACSGLSGHAVGRTDKTNTQGRRALYSTRERALRALRRTLELQFAAELADVDRMLEQA